MVAHAPALPAREVVRRWPDARPFRVAAIEAFVLSGVIELLDERPRVADGPRALGPVRGAVELDDVWFAYDDEPVLKGVTLRAAPGERVALVGASGAGKSTIARMLLRFGDPDRGAIRLDGHDVRDLQLASLRRNVAVLLQETLVLHGSVRENIAYARPDATDTEVEAGRGTYARQWEAHAGLSPARAAV